MAKFKVILSSDDMNQNYNPKDETELAIALVANLSKINKKKANNKKASKKKIKRIIISSS